MSQAKDIFFEILKPEIEKLGYKFKKSNSKFIKSIGDLSYQIDFNWDGRGGTTCLNYVSGSISLPFLKKASKQFLAYELDIWHFYRGSFTIYDETIPTMYSKELLDLANNMAFKKMSEMPFETKYPINRIENSANVVKKIILTEIIPYHQSVTSIEQILNQNIETVQNRLKENDTHNLIGTIFVIKLICKKLKISEPDFIKPIDIYSNKSIDDLWNIQQHEFEKIESRFNDLKL